MMKYEKPTYETENVEVKDIILASNAITDNGEGSLGTISGEKGSSETSFWEIF